MALFEEMLDTERRMAYLKYRESRGETDGRLQGMREYLLRGAYTEDVRRLARGEYTLSVPARKEIPKGYTDRKRTIYHFTEDEMTLLRMMAFVLQDCEDLIPREVYSFKRGISVKDLVWKISRCPELREQYVVKADVVSYGNSIRAERLIDMLRESFAARDPQALAFFTWLLRRRTWYSDGVLTEGDTAALPGIPIHNFFTNLYLTDTDRKLAPRCELYGRYSDDIILFQKTRPEAEENLRLLLSELDAHGLIPHRDEKTGIFEPGQAYDFLGFSFEGSQVDLARASVQKLKRRMRIRAKRIGLDRDGRLQTPEEKARLLIRLNRQTFFGKAGSNNLCWSQWAFPVITRTERLHELDLYNQQCIRYVMTGKWSDAGYRVRYAALKELGYESLVRSYYGSRSRAQHDPGTTDQIMQGETCTTLD